MSERPALSATGRAFLILSTLIAALAVTSFVPILPIIADRFATTPNAGALVRGLVSSISVAMIVGSLAAGPIAERVGIRHALMGALLLFGVAGAAGAATSSLGALFATRLLVGLAAAVVPTLVLALVAVAFQPAERDRWIGWLNAGGTVSSLLVMPLAGLVGSIDWRLVPILHLVSLPLIFLLVLGIPRRQAGQVAPEVAEGTPARAPLPAVIWPGILLALLGGALLIAMTLFVPFYLAEVGRGEPNWIALALVVQGATGAIVCLFYGRIRRYLSVPAVFAIGYASYGLFLWAATLTANYPIILVCLAIAGAGLVVTLPNLIAFAVEISTPEQSGRIIGMLNASLYAGGPLAQLVIEFLHLQGAASPIRLLAILSLLLVPLWVPGARLWQGSPR